MKEVGSVMKQMGKRTQVIRKEKAGGKHDKEVGSVTKQVRKRTQVIVKQRKR